MGSSSAPKETHAGRRPYPLAPGFGCPSACNSSEAELM
jgi:hypothetical protein